MSEGVSTTLSHWWRLEEAGLIYVRTTGRSGDEDFDEWAAWMLEEFGEGVRPYLPDVYGMVQMATQDDSPGIRTLHLLARVISEHNPTPLAESLKALTTRDVPGRAPGIIAKAELEARLTGEALANALEDLLPVKLSDLVAAAKVLADHLGGEKESLVGLVHALVQVDWNDDRAVTKVVCRHYFRREYAETHDSIGKALDDSGRHQEAIAKYEEAIRLRPDYALSHNNLGAAYFDVGRYEEAIAELKEAIRLKADFDKPHNNLGVIHTHLGRYEEVVIEYKEAIRIRPGDAQTHNNLGGAYWGLGRHKGWASECREGHPDSPPGYIASTMTSGLSTLTWATTKRLYAEYKETVRLDPGNTGCALRPGDSLCRGRQPRRTALDEYKILKGLDADLAAKLHFALIYP